jgi:hypothetical protein
MKIFPAKTRLNYDPEKGGMAPVTPGIRCVFAPFGNFLNLPEKKIKRHAHCVK